LKAVNDLLETNSKIENIRDQYRCVNGSKKGHQPRPNIVKDGKGDLVTESHIILAQLFNVLYMGLMMTGRTKYIQPSY
jgi:hypothetical protein